MPKRKYQFINDEPIATDSESYFDFYHKTIAPALKSIINNGTSPHTIGLFGAWGSGKSTIIKTLVDDPKLKLDLPVFIFDAWKYQEDTLRRTFLIEFDKFLRDQGIELPADILEPLYSSKSNTEQVRIKNKDQKRPPWHKRAVSFIKKYPIQLTAVVSVISYLVVSYFLKSALVVDFFKSLLGTLAGISGAIWIIKEFLGEAISNIVQTMLGAQKAEVDTRTVMTYQERLNSPEQFEKKFEDMLKFVDKKLVVVFDNIDRVQGSTAISMLSTIKNFMYAEASELVFIVPCDFEAIETQVAKYFDKNSDTSMPPGEYLRKIFNLTLWVPDFVSTDLEEYTKACLKETGTISETLNTEDVVLVINSAFSSNPREIIQFVNNLVAATMVAHNSEVKSSIDSNIAYLAKVLVIKQLYPAQYRLLKKYWYKPEAVLDEVDPEKDKAFVDFINKTNRITVDDAEPYIYLKDPATSRRISNATEIKKAIVTGDIELAVAESKKETNHQQLVEFISDLLIKYWGQTEVLLNVLRAQFRILDSLSINITSRRYFDNLIRTIDSQLWGVYSQLPHDDIFHLLRNAKLQKDLRRQIIERYIATLTGQEDVKDRELLVLILNKFRESVDLLEQKDLTKIRQFIEDKFSADDEILAMFENNDQQDKFVTDATIDKYISGINDENISTRVSNLERYKEFLVARGLLVRLTTKIGERLKNANAVSADFTELKQVLLESIKILVKTFRADLKEPEEAIKEIGAGLNQSFNGASNWENKAKVIIATWWVRAYLPDQERVTADSNVTSFLNTAPTEGRIQVLDYWNDPTTKRLISFSLSVLQQHMVNDPDLLNYVYSKASADDQNTILNYLITNVPAGRYADIDFINSAKPIPDRGSLLKALLNKTNGLRYDFRERYYSYIATNMRRNDSRELKDEAVSQIESLLQTTTLAESVVGYDFFDQSNFLSESDRRHIAINSLNWLREPSRTISIDNKHTINAIADSFDQLQDTPKNDFVYLVSNIINETASDQLIEFAFKILEQIRPPYSNYEKDYDDLIARLQAFTDINRKKTTLERLSQLVSSWKGRNIKKYQQTVSDLRNEIEQPVEV